MGIARFSAIVLTVLVLLASGICASGLENSGIGTKARGLAGAFRGVADDWTAAYYNPAGYAYLWDNQVGGNMAFVHYRDEIVPNVRWGGTYERGIYNDRINYNDHEILSNPSGGLVVRLPLAGETVFGLSAYQRFDFNTTWDMFQPLLSYSDSVSMPGDEFANNFDVVTFQLTAAREVIPDKLSLGIGLQLNRADLVYSNTYFRYNPISSSPNDPYYDIMADYPFDRITQWNKNNGNGWGLGFNLGGLARVNEKLQVGASINVPLKITVSGTAYNRFYMPNIPTLWENSDSAIIANPGAVGQLFLSGDVVSDSSDFETELKLPVSMGIGLSYQATERLTVSFDAEYTLWSMYEGFNFMYTNVQGLHGPADTSALANDFFSSDVSSPVDWENAGKVALGLQYEIPKFLSPDVALTMLGGAAADQSPARKVKQFTPQMLDTGDKYTFSLGALFHIQRWDIGVTSTYTHMPELVVAGVEMDKVYQRFPGTYKGGTYETIMSFNYRF